MQICEKVECTGCFACKQVCPKDAIKVSYDKNLKAIPDIDEEKCVNCGLCKKACPVNQELQYRYPKKCYAMWTKIQDDQKICSSGGIATGLGRYFIRKHGIVFGVGELIEDRFEICSAREESELTKFIGSRYVQCSTGNSYKEVRDLLKAGELVLYLGTPCQVGGLYSFLGKEYENLFTVDIICHGVPPMSYLMSYVKEKLPDIEIGNITFRGKNDFCLCVYNKTGDVVLKEKCRENLYFATFLDSLTYRDNCYNCKYARPERVADLTIGDFWELDKSSLKTKYDGRISVVLVNTLKGSTLVDSCNDFFVKEERPIEEALRTNDQLNEPSKAHEDRDLFLDEFSNKHSFSSAVKKTDLYKKKIRKEIIRNKMKRSIIFKIMKTILRRK